MLGEIFADLGAFLNLGGEVLKVIFLTTFLLWVLIAERFCFYYLSLPERYQFFMSEWKKREDHQSWDSKKIKSTYFSKLKGELIFSVPFIKTLVAVCPLLGLLGTVTGMIAVFDAMAISGTGNARSMASGISMATIPTMAGMVAALSGLYFGGLFENKNQKILEKFWEEMNNSAGELA